MNGFNLKFRRPKYVGVVLIYLLTGIGLQAMVCEIFASGSTRVSVFARVQVDDENILFGRIATIAGDDPILIKKLSSIVVAKAPLPGKSRQLEKKFLKMRLKQSGVDLADLVLQLPPKVVVTRSFIEIGKEKIKTLVSSYIRQNLSAVSGEVSIKDIRVAEHLLLPKGRITCKVIAPRNTDLMGKIPFSIKFDVNGNFYKRVRATATVSVLTDVVVTKKPLGRYKPITEDDIELQKMDLARLPAKVITDPEAVLGKRTKRVIGAKTVLRADLIELPPLVKRGDMVLIVAESDGFKITALGQVKKKGRRGERIPVINIDSKKILYARVLDSNTVMVEF